MSPSSSSLAKKQAHFYRWSTLQRVMASVLPHRGGQKPADSGAATPQEGENVASQALPFPSLKALVLRTLIFEANVPGSGLLIGDVVKTLIHRRKKCKASLNALSISDCVIKAKAAQALELLFPDFKWDKDEGISDETESDSSETQGWSSSSS
ncbi:hypothetical protein BC834DRAFT_322303 [Gloeopeniophorella convolvens]|nr:hypothetical protein BC834DRAFT_322303 [Gloeopeniophorella convolvens]